ncbi:MAG: tyrosine-specific transport protein [Chlamydiales bacterium]|jgi:tyrosine-specific transport protein
MTMSNKGKFVGGTFLIAGTSIGAGMLALPVLTSAGGFFPSLVLYFFCWMFMAMTGLLFLEACVWMGDSANFITMTKVILGDRAAKITSILYLGLFYCLSLAYIVGGAQLVVSFTGGTLPHWMGAIIFAVILAPVVCRGAGTVGNVNIVLVVGLVLSYMVFVYFGFGEVKSDNLQHSSWYNALLAMPVVFTSFAYQNVIPSLITYLDRDYSKVKWAIIIGSFIPFIIYAIWEWLILGIVPVYGVNGLLHTLEKGGTAVQSLQLHLENTWILSIGQLFAFLALVTSFLGVTLGLKDFLTDGLKIQVEKMGQPLIWFLVFIPPLIGAIACPYAFLSALNYAGGYGCALLLGVLPIIMVGYGRYVLKKESEFTLPGGKFLLFVLLLFVSIELCLETAQELGWTKVSSETETQIFLLEEESS